MEKKLSTLQQMAYGNGETDWPKTHEENIKLAKFLQNLTNGSTSSGKEPYFDRLDAQAVETPVSEKRSASIFDAAVARAAVFIANQEDRIFDLIDSIELRKSSAKVETAQDASQYAPKLEPQNA